MKKLFFLVCVMMSAMLTFAQETKKVAILEVVDREGRLSYSQKLVLRSNMARAVANTLGYEAYDRTDVDMIMSEHDFQRTGLVREDEIRRLGEMTGVSLILVTEGVLTDYNNIFVTAKILNVETGRVEIMDNMMMSLSGDGMQQGCTKLTTRLFGVTSNLSTEEKYKITRISNWEYEYSGKYMNQREYAHFLRNNCAQAYQQYHKGNNLVISGWILFCVGWGMTGGGLVGVIDDNAVGGITLGGILMGIGGGAVVSSIPILCVGYPTRKKALNTYNHRCVSAAVKPITLNLIGNQNGLGLAINF